MNKEQKEQAIKEQGQLSDNDFKVQILNRLGSLISAVKDLRPKDHRFDPRFKQRNNK